jgi:hypothetical protein
VTAFDWQSKVKSEGSLRAAVPEALASHSASATDAIIGNQAAQRFAQTCPLRLPSPAVCPFGGACHACPVQAKLVVNEPGDEYEEEADRVADQVMRMPEPQVQRQVEPEEEEEPIQAKRPGGVVPRVGPSPAARIHSLKGGGQPLPQSARDFFEPRFGRDFGRVRVHTGTRAAKASRAIDAQAFTLGQNIVFGPGRYAPGTTEGRRLLAHELTHVIQQRATKTPAGAQIFRKKKKYPGMAAALACRSAHIVEIRVARNLYDSKRLNEALAAYRACLRKAGVPIEVLQDILKKEKLSLLKRGWGWVKKWWRGRQLSNKEKARRGIMKLLGKGAPKAVDITLGTSTYSDVSAKIENGAFKVEVWGISGKDMKTLAAFESAVREVGKKKGASKADISVKTSGIDKGWIKKLKNTGYTVILFEYWKSIWLAE